MAKTARASKAADRAVDAYAAARENPYVQRLMEDDELRDNLRDAFEAVRDAYTRVAGNGRSPMKAVTGDKKVKKDLRQAADSLRDVSEQLRKPRRKRRGGFGKLLLIAVIGAGLALAFSEGARKAVLDALFGPEEEFEYTSTTGAGTNSSSS